MGGKADLRGSSVPHGEILVFSATRAAVRRTGGEPPRHGGDDAKRASLLYSKAPRVWGRVVQQASWKLAHLDLPLLLGGEEISQG